MPPMSFLYDESGVHRVQRVPVTESGGRIHTSAATVARIAHHDRYLVMVRHQPGRRLHR